MTNAFICESGDQDNASRPLTRNYSDDLALLFWRIVINVFFREIR